MQPSPLCLLLLVFLHASSPGSPFSRLKLAWAPAGLLLPALQLLASIRPKGVIASEYEYRVDDRPSTCNGTLPKAQTVCIRTSSPHTPMPHHVTVTRMNETDELSVCRKIVPMLPAAIVP